MNAEFNFDKMGGLLPAVVQDEGGGEVLMVGFMNREALDRTLAAGYVTFFSRTRNQLWMKG
jgi:phosphoribosyl-ATP pyrophosphohydrolase/phosphoribosyl-AMP cyclohydrolase